MMEQSQFKTPNHSDTLFPFPPHRRRHLKSETFCTLVRILSHCYGGESQHSHSAEVFSAQPKQGSGESGLEQGPDPEVRHGTVGPTCVESETWLTRREAHCLKDVGIDQCFDDRMEIDESWHVKGLINEHPGNGNKGGNTLEGNNPCENFVSLVGDQEGQCNLLEIFMEESGKERQEVDKEHPNCDLFDSLDLCLDMDIINEFRKLDDNNAEGSLFGERHALEHAGQETALTKLEKSVSSCGAMNSPPCSAADGQIEEGEISGSIGFHDQSTDLLVEHAVPLETKANKEQTSEAISNEEQVETQKGANQEDTKCSKNSAGTIVNGCNGVELTIGDSSMSGVDGNSEMVVCGQIRDAKMAHRYGDSELESRKNKKVDTRTNEKFNHPSLSADGVLLCYDDLYPAVPEKISGENATENKGNLSAKKQDAAVREKRKRGPMTEETKAKKKKKKRIKRAETNKRLGVKRLKIQPVVKPKTVTYCRHYLKGRCQEGEKCKFSHDTIPLTKSTPCCHFARHSCMKGDDCPFDHQLSKYPCNNFLSRGSCGRGTDCMFSHEIQPTECSPSTTTQLKSPSFPISTNLAKQSNSHASSQKVDSKSGSTVILPPRKKTENAAESVLKPAVQTPKGISKLMFGVSNQAGSFPKADVGAKFGLSLSRNTLGIAQNADENLRITEGLESKGVNFLSFGKSHLHDSSSKKPSSFSLSKDFGVQTSTLGNISKEKQAVLYSQKDGLKVGNHSQSATPVNGPRGINFLSFGKSPLDESSNKKLVTVPSNGNNNVVVSSIQEGENASNGKNNIVLSSVEVRPSASKPHIPNAEPWRMLSSSLSIQETESASKLEIPSAKPWKMLSSSLRSGKSMDRTADEDGKDTTISSLKALFSNTPNSAQKGSIPNMPNAAQTSLQSMLAFAAKYESRIKMDTPTGSTDSNQANSSSQSTRGSTIMDFLYSGGSKMKQ